MSDRTFTMPGMASNKITAEPIYVVGSHEEFMTALASKLESIAENGVLTIEHLSHAVASHDGELHWSALITGSVQTHTGLVASVV